jgi:hypothetical protein
MSARETAEKAVNLLMALGFILLALGILSCLFNLSQSYSLSGQAMLVVFGCVILILSGLAAKVFSRVGN